ncbi:MAG: uracil phosphoribosyltransferase [Marinilabiliaceae bacterium]|jgi:uracil phosphoribosyltransferase|nr:uracil phosphoribosyltransferase [Marinilabiliaceae bacterium]
MLNIINHPLIEHKLTKLRDKNTNTQNFRTNLDELAGLLAYEISRDLPTEAVQVETPVSSTVSNRLSKEIVLVPILRAGLGMVNGILGIIPDARVGHIGIARNEGTLKPEPYYEKLPLGFEDGIVMVVDPMLATGGSASAAITSLKEQGASHIKLVCIVGAPEGVKRIENDHPDVEIYLASLDEKLNKNGYIVPGLGDAGDRLFGTK